jgi:hypothetical protein
MIKTSQPHPMCLKIETQDKQIKLALFSDLHLDNPKCRRDLLKKDLDESVKEGRWIVFNGDTFCLMQGRYDPRKNKSAIRAEDNHDDYLDKVIDNTAEFLAPYAKRILLFGTGNHESAILKNIETNVLNKLVMLLKIKTGHVIYTGAYHGWIFVRFIQGSADKRESARIPYKIYYNHGAGGDAEVTQGTIEHQRYGNYVEGADAIWSGHNHNQYVLPVMVHYLDSSSNVGCVPKARVVHNIRTATYKQEYTDGGFHIEKRRRAKPIGFVKLDLKFCMITESGKTKRIIEPTVTPITHNEFDLLTPEQLNAKNILNKEIIRK